MKLYCLNCIHAIPIQCCLCGVSILFCEETHETFEDDTWTTEDEPCTWREQQNE